MDNMLLQLSVDPRAVGVARRRQGARRGRRGGGTARRPVTVRRVRACATRGAVSLDEFAALNATIAGDAAAIEDLRHAFCFFDADGNGTMFTTKLAIHGGVDPNLPEHRQAEAKRVLAAWRGASRPTLCACTPARGAAWRAAGRRGNRPRRAGGHRGLAGTACGERARMSRRAARRAGRRGHGMQRARAAIAEGGAANVRGRRG